MTDEQLERIAEAEIADTEEILDALQASYDCLTDDEGMSREQAIEQLLEDYNAILPVNFDYEFVGNNVW